jgi:hypothetical protein
MCPGFDSRLVNVGFVVVSVALGHYSLRVLQFSSYHSTLFVYLASLNDLRVGRVAQSV